MDTHVNYWTTNMTISIKSLDITHTEKEKRKKESKEFAYCSAIFYNKVVSMASINASSQLKVLS